MSALVEFLTARYDEDEQAARSASPGPWHLNAEGDEVMAVDDIMVAGAFALSGNQQRATAAHIARHDPARVLREVSAKRRIVYLAAQLPKLTAVNLFDNDKDAWAETLKQLALPYADHPDYREEWRP